MKRRGKSIPLTITLSNFRATHALLQQLRLTDTLIDLIFSLANYHPRQIYHRSERVTYRANDFNYLAISGIYLSTPPLPKTSEYLKLTYVKFNMSAADQGWAANGGEGTYSNSHTWFEVSILKPIRAHASSTPFEESSLTKLSFLDPERAQTFFRGKGWDFKNTGQQVTWRVHSNVTANQSFLGYEARWVRGEKTQRRYEVGRGIGLGDGKGFVELLEAGDRIVLWARAEEDLWENIVAEATIEIGYEISQATKSNDPCSSQPEDCHSNADLRLLRQMDIRNAAPGPQRKRLVKRLRALVKEQRTLPSSILLNDVVIDGSYPLSGGGYSDIWKGTDGPKKVCLKVLRLHTHGGDQEREKVAARFLKETLVWTQLNHPNVLPFLGVNTKLFPRGFCLVSPWMNNGHLLSFLEKNPEHDKLTAICEIAAGMTYLHSLSILHGDIKATNVLVDDHGRCLLADFGVSEANTYSTTTGMKGSFRWMAPEMFGYQPVPVYALETRTHNARTKLPQDVYAFGCTVLEVISGKPPFFPLTDPMVMFQVLNNVRPERPKAPWCPPSVWSLVGLCWAADKHIRPPAAFVYAFLTRLKDLRGANLPWERIVIDGCFDWEDGDDDSEAEELDVAGEQ
ncbi:MAP kinase kinase kinase activity protein [Marasmius sp. AFHP31]|nr:MAP kinase kinase kinase activity protein [Marasmius sp. AFHP31]